MKTLLFTGGGGAATEDLYRLLSDRYVVHFCDANPDAKPLNIPDARWHVIPSAKGEDTWTNREFVPELAWLCQQLHVSLLIPGVDEELRPLTWAVTHGFPCDVLMPDSPFVFTHLDKLLSMRVLAAAGIPVPNTLRLQPKKDEQAWPVFPGVLKPREGRGSRGVVVVSSPLDYIVQERLEGQEYTVTMVADKSQHVRAIVPAAVLAKDGVTTHAMTTANLEVMEACRAIHHAMPTAGVYNIQGVNGADGFKPFEINPRVSTTTVLAMRSGVDVIGLSQETSDGTQPLADFHATVLKRSKQVRWTSTITEAA